MIPDSQKKIMVFGTFDILHPGHLNFFEQAKEYGDYLIVVVARDKTVEKVKGKLPQNPENVRVKNIENATIANEVVLGGAGDKYEIIREFRPDCICLGYDQKFFIDNLKKEFPNTKIVRLKAYKPNIYKSSLIKSSLMANNKQITIFHGQKIRRIWDDEKEKWYFSIVDVVGVLSQSANPQNYWKVLKNRLKKEGSEVVTKCNHLKMMASDGKYYLTDAADTEVILRLIQSIPSPNAEPFKLWLAKVGYERIQETVDPEKSINRGRMNWQRMGRNTKWIQQRMMGQEIRNKLTDYWRNSEVKEKNEYAILTNIIHQEWSDLSVKEHKNLKKLKTENLRDHMTDAELVFTALAELSTRQIAETMKTKGLEENKTPARKGGRIAKNARKELENKTGRKVVSGENFLQSPKNDKKIKGKN